MIIAPSSITKISNDMVTINGKNFYNVPYMCGGCPFYLGFGRATADKDSLSGRCILFDKKKGYYSNIPKRCKTLFDKALTYPDGKELVVVLK